MRFVKIWPLCVSILMIANTAMARQTPESFADLAEELLPTVVNISTTQTVEEVGAPAEELFSYRFPEGSPFNDLPELLEKFYGQNRPHEEGNEGEPIERKAMSLGSGFIIDKTGYIVTNNHVIDKAEEIKVIFSNEKEAIAKIVGRDVKMDLALLKVEVNHPLPAVKLGESDEARVGDWVVAIGNPFGLGGSVSAGIISARARDINAGPFDDFLQTDAAINRGNSGGPLFNVEGEVIGINTAIFSPSGGNVGIGFSLPIDLATPIIKQLKETGKVERGWLGVKIQNVTNEIAQSIGLKRENGALVLEVTPDSPAAKAGIMTGDVILEFDGQEVVTMRKLPRIVADTPIGKKVEVVIWRKGQKQKLQAEIALLDEEDKTELSHSGPSVEKKAEKPSYGATINELGMELAELTDKNRKNFRIKEDKKGVLVVSVSAKTNAAERGMMPGDIIESINQEPVRNLAESKAAIDRAKAAKRNSVLLFVTRRGASQFVVVNLK